MVANMIHEERFTVRALEMVMDDYSKWQHQIKYHHKGDIILMVGAMELKLRQQAFCRQFYIFSQVLSLLPG